MPTYEYLCESCKWRFERFQSITAKPLRACPKCGKRKVKRLIGAGAGVIFKGSGFYQTDYRSEGYKPTLKHQKPKLKNQNPTKKANPAQKSKRNKVNHHLFNQTAFKSHV